MTLPEAIRLGAMLKPQAFRTGVPGKLCTLEAAAEAAGLCNWSHTRHTWRELDTDYEPCFVANCPVPYERVLIELVYHLNDYHRCTREAIADWLESRESSNIQEVDRMQETLPVVNLQEVT